MLNVDCLLLGKSVLECMLDVSRLLCDEDITPSDAKLGGEEDQPGRPSPNGGPIKLKLESALDLRSNTG